MRTEALVERLARDLQPVRRRSPVREACGLLLLGGAEVAAFIGLGFMRPDMTVAMHSPSFWWRLLSLGLIAALGAAVALVSADPAHSPRRGLRWLLACLAVVLAAGWLLCAQAGGFADLLGRLHWAEGLQCVWKMVALSVPPALALGLLLRRGAPADPGGVAWAAGLSAAAWGAFVFVFACPSDDPVYIGVWYMAGCSAVTLLVRAVLPRVSRW